MYKRKGPVFAAILLMTIMIAALTVNYWIPEGYLSIDSSNRLLKPSFTHWFGTDHFGRDLFGLTISAAKVSIFVGFVVALVATLLGTVTGLIAGYYKKIDFIIMRIIDGMLAFPSLLLALALVAALGGSISNIIIALSLSFWPAMTRIVRSQVLQVCELQYIEAAKMSGENDGVILVKYVLPNVLSPIIVQGTFIFAKAILAEAALSFLGAGVNPSIPTWGNMLQEAQIYMTIAPWYSIFPGLAIVITVLLLNIIGENIRHLFDPRATKSKKKDYKKKLKAEKRKLAKAA